MYQVTNFYDLHFSTKRWTQLSTVTIFERLDCETVKIMQCCQFILSLFVNYCGRRVVSEEYFNRNAWRLFSLVIHIGCWSKRYESYFLEQQTWLKVFIELTIQNSAHASPTYTLNFMIMVLRLPRADDNSFNY